MNIQSPEPLERNTQTGNLLSVHSIFHTIQGEGPFSGMPAVFVRLGGCNLQCPGCDTEYTAGRLDYTVNQILEYVDRLYPETPFERPRLVVITGGEPFRQNVSPLAAALVQCGAMVQFETNGTLAPLADFPKVIRVVCSPKTRRVAFGLLPFIFAYKYVLQAGHVAEDGLPSSVLGTPDIQPARPHLGFTGPVYVSPMDEQDSARNRANLDAAVLSCLRFGYILNLQVHKLVGLP
jgi:7-carboxy-7-deazaguanine synthase